MKMRKSSCLAGLILIILFAFNCASFMKYGQLEKSARSNYLAKNYDTAVFQCAQSLRLNPKYEKAQTLIQDAYKAAVLAHENKIKNLKERSTRKFKWDDVVSELQALIKLKNTIEALPIMIDKKTNQEIRIKTHDYSGRMNNAKNFAAESHYNEGLELAKQEGIEVQKRAAKEFKAAEKYVPLYKDAHDYYERCRQAGIKRIAIIPFEDKTGKGNRYGAIADMVADDVINDVMNDQSAMEFLQIISRDQLQQVMAEQKIGMTGIIDEKTALEIGKILGVHAIVTGKLTGIIYTPERTISKTVKEQGEVPVGTEKYVDSKGKVRERTKWATDYATVTIYTRTSNCTARGSFRIIDVKTAQIKKASSVEGKSQFKANWATFTGNKDVISENKYLIKKNEQLAPVEDEMVNNALKNLSKSLANTLKAYAR